MVLTGPNAGKSGTLNGHRFEAGKCEVVGTPEQLANVAKYFRASYEVEIEGQSGDEQPDPRSAGIIEAALQVPFADWDRSPKDGLGPMPKIADMAPLVGRYDLTREEMARVFGQWPHLLKDHIVAEPEPEE